MASASAAAEANKALFLEKVIKRLDHDDDDDAHDDDYDDVKEHDLGDDVDDDKNVQVRESNTACQAGDFEKAVGLYTEAIALDKCNHILYSNRFDNGAFVCLLVLLMRFCAIRF